MAYIILTLVLVLVSVFLLSFNVIFRKGGKFPETEVGHNRNMRNLGLRCAKSEERELWTKKDNRINNGCSSCGCSSICEEK
ncbi:MAG: hypothetical protein PHP30_06570 [Bacteroidales bacterium]|jgi:hypothetical protein|nr:hypothetical protein [Bacteroidales bacterium]MDD2424876.1 hypothetical protein [Bacteroidales bacterium]MDD3989739.1 hypothetical protein [Bacteroidales bacterium]